MTETMMPPVATDEPEASTGTRKPVLVAGGLAAVLALAGGGYLLLGGGGSSSTASSAPLPLPRPARLATAQVPKASAVASGKKAATLPAVTHIPLGRDPFIALYVQPAAAAAGTAAATGSAGATSAGTTTAPTSTSTGTGTTSTASTTSTTPTITTSYPVVLRSIVKVTGGGRLYTFTYGGITKKVLNGQRFGKYGELVVLGNTTNTSNAITGAILQVGDDEPLTIAIGEKITVK